MTWRSGFAKANDYLIHVELQLLATCSLPYYT